MVVLHDVIGYGVMVLVFNLKQGALPRGIMQDYDALPQDAVQYNHDAVR
jgi:hypothetical protein